jgi:hypothetical protein
MFIRPMETNEIDLVINLFNYYKEEAGVDLEKFSENRVLATVRQYCIKPNLFFRVAFNGLRPVGLIGGFLSEDPVEDETTATIQFNYLMPEFASTENYGYLVNDFEKWAKSMGIEQIRAIDIGNNIDRLKDVYDDLGFNPIRIAIMNKEIE